MSLPTIEEVAAKFSQSPAPAAAEAAPAPEAKDPGPAAAETPAEAAPSEAVTPDAPSETPSETAPTEARKPDGSAARFAALARREREARQRETEINQRLRDAESRAAALAEKEARLSQKPANPLDLLKTHGFSLEDANLAAFGQAPKKDIDPVDAKVDEKLNPVAARLAEYEETIKTLKTTLDQIQTERVQHAKQAVRNDIIATAQKEGHEVIQAIGPEAYELVESVIASYAKQRNQMLNYSQACAIVEEHYTEAIIKLAATPKMKSRLAPPTAATPAPAKPKTTTTPPAKERPETLTQAHSAGSRVKKDVDSMPKHEALEYLASKIQFITK